ncbi:hypothetical protein [Massilia sp. TS11]|uniref:hypothetical protein n=1 Tax=Massilia sp. TS11 TaxID=2908003 RepID=UPI001EDA7F17|nr:hypothetical protein [Massilia sp. TS11]MCG2583781.1 hypothetical protein [Massilia sp. TS11]
MRITATLHYLLACGVALLACWMVAASAVAAPLPPTLSATGFPLAGQGGAARLIAYRPQYPLWTDGADKQRWLALPKGGFIDARQIDAWSFPAGTRLWKQFSFEGKPVETRFMRKGADGRWQFATYVWRDDGTDAVLAPERGLTLNVPSIRGGRYVVPGRADCLVCHGSAAQPVLGLTALQLSSARDPLAPNGEPLRPGETDLAGLVAAGWVRRLSALALAQPPQVAGADPLERAALGYLHGNCAHCHNTSPNKAPLDLTLAQRAGDPAAARAEVLASLIGQRPRSSADAAIVTPGQPQHSLLLHRMQSRQALTQMPPLGTQMPDPAALDLITRWIAALNPSKEK